jgi:hypothetical protein
MADADELAGAPSADAVASKAERLDFLKLVVNYTEANVRSYDLKAQISLAAFVLSGNPTVAIVYDACGPGPARGVLVITLIVYIATILSYLWVLWPVATRHKKLTEGLAAQNLFFVTDALAIGGSAYLDKIKGLMVEPELAGEVTQLSYIRGVKAWRFKLALIATLCAYLVVAAAFFGVGRCGF